MPINQKSKTAEKIILNSVEKKKLSCFADTRLQVDNPLFWLNCLLNEEQIENQ